MSAAGPPAATSGAIEPRGPATMAGEVRKVIVQAGAYDGQRHDGYRHGQGCYMWSNGQKYDGEWRNDMRNGQGTETWPDGRRYHGEWKNDTFHGRGVWTWADGRVFQGNFEHYCPTAGELFMPDGTMFHVVYDGQSAVFDGVMPVPMLQTVEADEQLVQRRQEEMYEMLCTNRVLSQMLRERWIKGDDVELSQGEQILRIDEVFLRAREETRRSFEVRRSLDAVRPIDQEAKRKRGELSNALQAPSPDPPAPAPVEPSSHSPRSSVELVEHSPATASRIELQVRSSEQHRQVSSEELTNWSDYQREKEGHWSTAEEEEEEEELNEDGAVRRKGLRWRQENFSASSGSMMEEARRISLEVRSRVSLEMKRMSLEVRKQIGTTGLEKKRVLDGEGKSLLYQNPGLADLDTIPGSPVTRVGA